MASEHGQSPTDYIVHHMTHNSVGQGFWTWHVDTLVMSAVTAAFVAFLLHVLKSFPAGSQAFPNLGVERLDDVRLVGFALFNHFNLPFQTVGVLVLVASIGVVVLSRRELK
jgi:NADH:ubiquinone oxidoreductase subunit 6 (subunit J)